MPYHHNKRHRNSRLFIFAAAAVISIGVGAVGGYFLASQKANALYTDLTSTINQRYAKQVQKMATQSKLGPAIASNFATLEKTKTYPAAMTSVEKLRQSLAAFNTSATENCDDTTDHITTLDMTPVTKSKYIPSSVRQGFDTLRTGMSSGDACQHARELVAYNNFSIFSLTTASTIKQIQDTNFADKTAVKQLQDQLQKAPTATEVQTLKTKYGTAFSNYTTAYVELVKSYSGLSSAKSNKEFLLQIERLEASTEKVSSYQSLALKDYATISLKDARTALTNARSNYEAVTQINAMSHEAKIDTAPFLSVLLVNAISLYFDEQQSYPGGNSLAELVQTLRSKNYLKNTDSFTTFQYTFDAKSNIYKLTVPTMHGEAVFEFFNSSSQKTNQLETKPQVFTVQT